MLTKSVSLYRKVLARMPGGYDRVIQINERTNKARWVVHINGRSHYMPGSYSMDKFGVEFHFDYAMDEQYVAQNYKPVRNSYGPVIDDNEAYDRLAYYIKRRNQKRKKKAA